MSTCLFCDKCLIKAFESHLSHTVLASFPHKSLGTRLIQCRMRSGTTIAIYVPVPENNMEQDSQEDLPSAGGSFGGWIPRRNINAIKNGYLQEFFVLSCSISKTHNNGPRPSEVQRYGASCSNVAMRSKSDTVTTELSSIST